MIDKDMSGAEEFKDMMDEVGDELTDEQLIEILKHIVMEYLGIDDEELAEKIIEKLLEEYPDVDDILSELIENLEELEEDIRELADEIKQELGKMDAPTRMLAMMQMESAIKKAQEEIMQRYELEQEEEEEEEERKKRKRERDRKKALDAIDQLRIKRDI